MGYPQCKRNYPHVFNTAPSRTEGLYHRDALTMHVSRGVGTTFVPFRFFARPEVTVLRVVG